MSKRKGFIDEEIVESRLRLFINKYYKIKLIQGLLLTFAIGIIIVFGLVIFGNIIPVGQKVFNFIELGSSVFMFGILVIFIFKPAAQKMGIIKGLNFKEASSIIQQKHKTVEDRIINIIELTREKAGQNNILYDYAIAQKTKNIQDIQFEDAISLRKIGQLLIRLTLLVVICTGAVLLWPDFVKKGIGAMLGGNEQEVAFNQIKFVIDNDSLEVESGKDFILRFQVIAEIQIENVSVVVGSTQEKAEKVKEGYVFLFKGVNSSVSFRLSGNGKLSGEYVLKTLKRPEIAGLQLKMLPPDYTGLESTVIDGDGDAEIPAGTNIVWTIRTVNTNDVLFIEEEDSVALKGKGNVYGYDKRISNNVNYEILCRNKNGLSTSYIYKISVVKDLFPTIDISESRDSTLPDDVYVQGIIQDDYGFNKLEVVEIKLGKESIKEINIKKISIYENFYYSLIPDSNSTVYYFRIWDNDQVTGPKFTESRKISLRTITKEEIENVNSQLVDSIRSNMSDGMTVIDKMEKKISEFKIEQILGELKPWEIQERMKELNELKREVVDFINNVAKADKEYTENEKILNQDKEYTERVKQIQDLMENLLDEEMKELLKQFEELAKEFNSNKADELTDKMEINLEKLKEQMEMSLELLKKYDLEKDLIKQVEQLKKLADSLKIDKSKNGEEGINLKEEFKKWEQNFEKNLQQNTEFKKPMDLENLENEREEVRKAAEKIQKEEAGGSASENRSKASASLKKLAKKLEDMLGMMNGEAQFVDLEDLRQIRNSLNDYSKRQEELNNRISNINSVNPTFTAVIKEQKDLEYKFLNIRDSLKSIGYKQPVITKVIGSELFHVETSLHNLFKSYEGNRANIVRVEQNRIMSEINSIALKMDELIKSLQDAKGSGSGNKGFTDRKKPKDGEKSGSDKLGETKSMQESLKEQLKSSIKKMKSGAQGKKERGEMAQMLGEREMMRKALEKIGQGGGLGKEAKEKANEALNMMKEVEKDIIYNRLSEQTLEKDNLIKTKLLEAENAEKERENENRRESKEFKGNFEPVLHEVEKGVDQNKAMEQMLKYNELKLKRFYQEKYLKYIESTKK
ncbi:MAG: hypothetical protein NTV01_14405 [Bacteroidia bacterium]|nr:hypothetical protein [Bacteroidia bacterium]